MEQVKDGDVVRVHYTGKLTNGEQFDSSAGREPLEFTVGAGQMIKGFDDAMPGMSVGEKKTINILPADAYGRKANLVIGRNLLRLLVGFEGVFVSRNFARADEHTARRRAQLDEVPTRCLVHNNLA